MILRFAFVTLVLSLKSLKQTWYLISSHQPECWPRCARHRHGCTVAGAPGLFTCRAQQHEILASTMGRTPRGERVEKEERLRHE